MSLQQMLLGAGGSDPLYIDDLFSQLVYQGVGNQNVNHQNGLDMTKGGLVWAKSRSDTMEYHMWDTKRGVEKYIRSDDTTVETTQEDGLVAFNTNGFTLSDSGRCNSPSRHYMSWSWLIQKGFMDVVTYEGTGTTQNISHSLGSVPGLIMIKKLNGATDWVVYHRDRGNESFGKLNETDAFWTGNDIWDSTSPTSTTFRVNGNNTFVNADDDDYVAYVFGGGASTNYMAGAVDFGDNAHKYLTIPDSSDLDLGSTFTIEFWVNPVYNGQGYNNIYMHGSFHIDVLDSGTVNVEGHGGSPGSDLRSQSKACPEGQWTHVAVVVNSGVPNIYINGLRDANPDITSINLNKSGDPTIGKSAAGTAYAFNGKISNFRIVVGTAVYTSAFIPSKLPLANITNTKLLCCNSFSDVTGATVTPGTITSTGTPTVSTSTPFDDPAGLKFGAGGDQDIIKCGSWKGDGSTTDVPVNLNWEPQWIMVKNVTSSGGGWIVLDNVRGWYSKGIDIRLEVDDTGGEYAGFNYSDLTATGFVTGTTTGGWNSDDTFIYMAIRRPDGYVGKPAAAGTDVFAMDFGDGASSDTTSIAVTYDSAFQVDWALRRDPTATSGSAADWLSLTRLMNDQYLIANETSTEATYNNSKWDSTLGIGHTDGSSYHAWMWKRHAGFDVVRGNFNSSESNNGYDVRHNLGVVPEMIIRKKVDTNSEWNIYHIGANEGTDPEDYRLKFSNVVEQDSAYMMGDYAPTATAFRTGSAGDTLSLIHI